MQCATVVATPVVSTRARVCVEGGEEVVITNVVLVLHHLAGTATRHAPSVSARRRRGEADAVRPTAIREGCEWSEWSHRRASRVCKGRATSGRAGGPRTLTVSVRRQRSLAQRVLPNPRCRRPCHRHRAGMLCAVRRGVALQGEGGKPVAGAAASSSPSVAPRGSTCGGCSLAHPWMPTPSPTPWVVEVTR